MFYRIIIVFCQFYFILDCFRLVDTYGTPRYREANPMLFTCITFPFLFGIMYFFT